MSKKKNKESVAPEWSYLFSADDVQDQPVKMTISPNEEETQLLMKRLDLLSLDELRADLVLNRESGGIVVHVVGQIKAQLTQPCVVSLEPVEATITEEIEAWYEDLDQAVSLARVRQNRETTKGEKPVLSEQEDPEPMVEGQIDLGELVTQYLSLYINPYPHKEGVDYEGSMTTENADDPSASLKSPFAALKDWKTRQR